MIKILFQRSFRNDNSADTFLWKWHCRDRIKYKQVIPVTLCYTIHCTSDTKQMIKEWNITMLRVPLNEAHFPTRQRWVLKTAKVRIETVVESVTMLSMGFRIMPYVKCSFANHCNWSNTFHVRLFLVALLLSPICTANQVWIDYEFQRRPLRILRQQSTSCPATFSQTTMSNDKLLFTGSTLKGSIFLLLISHNDWKWAVSMKFPMVAEKFGLTFGSVEKVSLESRILTVFLRII